MTASTPSQEEIFSSYNWWDTSCALWQITKERADYIEFCINHTLGQGAFQEQEILDVGCGGGLLCEELAHRGAIMYGIDPSPSALATAQTHTQQVGLGQNVYYQQGYAESLPYADGSFSAVICLDVLEHVDNLYATIQEIARVLAPGGIFVFDTINRTLFARIALLWVGETFFAKNGLTPGMHRYSKFIKPSGLRRILMRSDLYIGELTGFMPHGFKDGRLILGPGWFTGVSYAGYAIKGE